MPPDFYPVFALIPYRCTDVRMCEHFINYCLLVFVVSEI
nr:MAG TPA: Lecithin retinol acyltransferase [Caudoviricetes sp.]